MKKNKFTLLAVLFVMMSMMMSCESGPKYVVIETDMGNMRAVLYDETPKHRDNFVKLVKDGFYDGLLFHRVVNQFMVQGGDPDSRGASQDKRLGNGGPGYEIEAEIGAPHLKGTLAAARTSDAINPDKKSSGSQFYIVHGRPISAQELGIIAQRHGIQYNEEQTRIYNEKGGTPQLDMGYTVFGELVEGHDVLEKIAATAVDGNPPHGNSRPLKDVVILCLLSINSLISYFIELSRRHSSAHISFYLLIN